MGLVIDPFDRRPFGRRNWKIRDLERFGDWVGDLIRDVREPLQFGFDPMYDIDDLGDRVIVNMDMPGIDKKDIKVNLTQTELHIRAKNEDTERSYQSRIPIPDLYQYDLKGLSAVYRRGILSITLPKIGVVEEGDKAIRVEVE